MKSGSLLEAIVELSHERGLDQDSVISAMEDAILHAAKRKYKNYRYLETAFNRKTGDIELMRYRVVVENVTDSENEILLEEVQKLDPLAEIGDEVEYEIDQSDFIKVIAQTSRQFLFQKIREVERDAIMKKFSTKKGEIIHGTVGRIERSRAILSLSNNAEASLEKREQIPTEKLQSGEHIRAFLFDIYQESKRVQLMVSRTHPNFLIKLFEVEVPEVYDGVIEIIHASREPGKRAKISVRSNDIDVDPVGSCVGPKGARVQAIVSELCGERIDIVEWSEDIRVYIARAISPAEVVGMTIDEEKKLADVEVETNQLSLAIGKEGQNVRLASQLTGYKINVFSWEPKLNREQTENQEQNLSDKEQIPTEENIEKTINQEQISSEENIESIQDTEHQEQTPAEENKESIQDTEHQEQTSAEENKTEPNLNVVLEEK